MRLTIWSLPSRIALIPAGYALHSERKNPSVPGVTAMMWLCGCVMVWTGGQLLGTLVTGPNLKLFFAKLESPGSAYIAVCWFWFAVARETPRLRRLVH